MTKLKKCACIEPMYAELPFYDRFQAAKDDGFEAVEFWGWTDKDLGRVERAASQAGIAISGFNGDADFSLIAPEEGRSTSRSFAAASMRRSRSVRRR